MKSHINYFPGLHALRFLAATMVIFHHVEQYKSWAGKPNIWGDGIINSLGHMPVSFFFVLSGFLITYLILVEHEKNGQINVGKFYMRRILRIWPLYFVIVAAALWVVPVFGHLSFIDFQNPTNTTSIVILLFLFLPNVLRTFAPNVVGANQLWSVGIEEQFYLIWPLLVGKFVHKIIPFLVGFVALKFIGHVALIELVDMNIHERLPQILHLYRLFPVEQMAIGGIGAAFLFKKKEAMSKFLSHKYIFHAAVGLTLGLVMADLHFWTITYLEGVLFLVIILRVISNKKIHSLLENRHFKHLGNISYGIYMWHTLVITLSITVLDIFGIESVIFWNTRLYAMSVLLTIGISHISYKYFETPFLQFKERFEIRRLRLQPKVSK